jgi:acyl carrier protein
MKTPLFTTIERLHELFAESFNVEPPAYDVDLLGSGILDSLQFVELLVQIEQRFNFAVNIEDVSLDDLRTLESIARLLNAREAAAAAVGAHGVA